MVLFQEYVESDSFAEEVGHKVEAVTADSAMQVTVVGYVGSTEDAQTIKYDSIDAAVFCYWPSIGTLCGEIAKDMYQGTEVPERSNIELYGMDKTQVDQLLEDVIG